MPDSIQTFVVDTIVRWAQRQVEPDSPPRINVRLVFGSSEIVAAVQDSTREIGAGLVHRSVFWTPEGSQAAPWRSLASRRRSSERASTRCPISLFAVLAAGGPRS